MLLELADRASRDSRGPRNGAELHLPFLETSSRQAAIVPGVRLTFGQTPATLQPWEISLTTSFTSWLEQGFGQPSVFDLARGGCRWAVRGQLLGSFQWPCAFLVFAPPEGRSEPGGLAMLELSTADMNRLAQHYREGISPHLLERWDHVMVPADHLLGFWAELERKVRQAEVEPGKDGHMICDGFTQTLDLLLDGRLSRLERTSPDAVQNPHFVALTGLLADELRRHQPESRWEGVIRRIDLRRR